MQMIAHLFGGEVAQGTMQRGLQPFAGANFALIAEAMTVRPTSTLHQQANRLFNLTLVRVAFIDDRLRQAVCAEKQSQDAGR